MDYESLFRELSALTNISAPSGFEDPMIHALRDAVAPCVDEMKSDVRGNLFACKYGSDPDAPVIMVVAHMDEIGLMVNSVTESGFLRFSKIGGPTDMVLPGHRVRLLTDKGELDGIIGVKPGHILSGDESGRVPAVDDMYIDAGMDSCEEAARAGIQPGTPAVFDGIMSTLNSERLVYGKAVDDRAGILSLLKTAERLKDTTLSQTVIWCFSVEEEIGLRGADVAAKDLSPDVLIAIDTCPAGGTPELSSDQLPWRIGKGPLLKVRETRGLATHPKLRKIIIDTCEKNAIPFQLIVDTAGITDASSAQQAGGAIAAASVGLARRYSHSSVEVLDLDDLKSLIDLLFAVIPAVTDKKMLMR